MVSPPGELTLGSFQKRGIRGALDSEGLRGACSDALKDEIWGFLISVASSVQWGPSLALAVRISDRSHCVLHTQPSDLSALVGVQLVAESRLEPRASASEAGTLPSAPCCLLPWKVLEGAGGSKHGGGVFRLPDMLTAGGAPIDRFLCPCCVAFTFF